MKNFFINILFFLFISFLLYPNIERILYLNELFAIIGLCFFIGKWNNYINQKDIALNCILFYISYCFIYSIISFLFLKKGSNYEFIRTLPVWYSSLTFFVGVEFVKKIKFKNWFGSVKANLFFVLCAFIFPGRLSNQLLLPFMLINKRTKKLFVIISFLFFFYKGGATSYISLATLLWFIYFDSKRINNIIKNKLFLPSLFLLFLCVLWWFDTQYGNFFIDSNYERIKGISDNNTIWRLMFWIYQFKINIINSPIFGIGFGTPLFDLRYIPEFLTSDDGSRATPYTLGTHNSLVFVLIRLGIIGLALLLIMYNALLKAYFTGKNSLIQTVFFYLFIFITLAMLFNVILESPIYGGIYWIVIGMFYQSLKLKKAKLYEEKQDRISFSSSTTGTRSFDDE